MIKFFFISSLIILNLNGWAQVDSLLYEKYMKKGDSIFLVLKEDPKNKGVKFDSSVNAYNAAMLIYPGKADNAREKIKKVFEHIESERLRADSLREIAEKRESEIQFVNKEIQKQKDQAIILQKEAETLQREAEAAKNRVYQFNIANAPYKYARLIRDGPVEKGEIQQDTFQLKLIAYCYHLKILENILDSIPQDSIPGARLDYDRLVENLYYNNELYEKIYYCLDYYDKKAKILEARKPPAPDLFNIRLQGDGRSAFRLPNNGSAIIRSISGKDMDSVKPEGRYFTSFTVSDKQKLVFCATDDNFIVSYKFGDEGKLTTLDSIAMGAQVTAIDFSDDSSTLFFGTKGGDIGFIEYDGYKKKYQPVYSTENYLTASMITGIDIFRHEGSLFLLATGFDGKAVVYHIDHNLFQPENKFSGNFLPDPKKELGNILHAIYDEKEKRIWLETSGDNKSYLWDPFTKTALENYKKVAGDIPAQILEGTNYYKEK